nr:transporter substrate-binding domain-containing protein [uncultured Albidiferax sp.]
MRIPLVSLVLLSTAAAHGAVQMATFPIPVHVESDTKGLFVELVREVAKQAQTDIQIQVMPPPRAVQGFLGGSFGGLFPALDVNFAANQPIVRTSEAIDCKEDFVFTKKGSPFLQTLADLKGKRVGITRGYPYAREVTDNTAYTVELANTDEANIQKLVAGYLDAFVLDEKTGLKAFEKLGMVAQMQYAPKVPVSRQEVYYAFQNTAEGKALADKFSQALKKMKQSGQFQKITQGITFANGCAKAN